MVNQDLTLRKWLRSLLIHESGALGCGIVAGNHGNPVQRVFTLADPETLKLYFDEIAWERRIAKFQRDQCKQVKCLSLCATCEAGTRVEAYPREEMRSRIRVLLRSILQA